MGISHLSYKEAHRQHRQLNTSTESSYFQSEIRKWLLFSFAHEQKGATTHDETERENPRGIDRRD